MDIDGRILTMFKARPSIGATIELEGVMKLNNRTVSTLIPVALLIIFSLAGCTKTVYVPYTNNGDDYTPPPPTTSVIYTPPPSSTPITLTANSAIIGGGGWTTIGSLYAAPSKTLTLTWSADGSLDCFILTQNQYNNFVNSGIGYVSSYLAYKAGSSNSISAYIQNGDNYYAVLRGSPLFGPSVNLYHATLVEQ
jgi:hypothetical protein